MKKILAVAAALAALSATPARAEEPAARVEVAPLVGAYIPILDQRSSLDRALLAGLVGTYDFHPNVAFVGSVAWAGTKSAGEALDLFQWDIGLQGQVPYALTASWTLKPFVGVGVGTRTYDFRHAGLETQTDFHFYSAAGASLRRGALDVGLTLRHELTSGGPYGESETRGNLAPFASVAYRF
ncbi:MAG: outer membrane beta-barrel protein [Anaeromyxobacter sp.]